MLSQPEIAETQPPPQPQETLGEADNPLQLEAQENQHGRAERSQGDRELQSRLRRRTEQRRAREERHQRRRGEMEENVWQQQQRSRARAAKVKRDRRLQRQERDRQREGDWQPREWHRARDDSDDEEEALSPPIISTASQTEAELRQQLAAAQKELEQARREGRVKD